MPYYPQINLLFIHVPKTGGTSLEKYFRKYSSEKLFSTHANTNAILPHPHASASLQHQPYKTIYAYQDLLDIRIDADTRIISVVRNPYDRIISDLFWYKLIERDTSPSDVYDVICQYMDADCYDNHNIPQYMFLTDESGAMVDRIKIFRTETLTQELRDYGFGDYDGDKNQTDYGVYLNAQSIALINRVYCKDFDLFGYPRRYP